MKTRKTIIICIFVLLVVSSCIFINNFQIIKVKQNSMEPTLISGEKGIMVKSKKINNNDIVVINKNDYLIKRVVALPNEIIDTDQGKISVPKDCYYVLGDNKKVSIDSRYFGFVNKEEIVGKVILMFGIKGVNKLRLV